MKKLAIIPARYASSRFPGKPLVEILGKPMIQLVYEAVRDSALFDHLVVATDDGRIYDAVEQFEGNVMMTSSSHRSGTERCIEMVEKFNAMGHYFDVIVNIQGDEPGIKATQIKELLDTFNKPDVRIASLYKRIEDEADIVNPNTVKCVFSKQGKALYFSRSPIPYPRNKDKVIHYKHIGIYGYRNETLTRLKSLPPSPLEQSESLEQLRWLENDIDMYLRPTSIETTGIDTPEDLARFLQNLRK